MKKLSSLLLIAMLASCGANNSSLHGKKKGANDKNKVTETATTSTDVQNPSEKPESDNVFAGDNEGAAEEVAEENTFSVGETQSNGETLEQDLADQVQDQVQDQSQEQTELPGQLVDNYHIDQAKMLCESLSIRKTGDYMLTSVVEQGHTELNSNVACLVRTAYTPKKISVKMLTNVYDYKELNTMQDHVEFAIGDLNKCNYKESVGLVQKIQEQIRLNGCKANVYTRTNSRGEQTLDRVVAHSCTGQYAFQACNRFKKSIKTCLKTNDDTIKLNFSKARELQDGEFEVYYVRLDQHKKSKRYTDFSVYEVLSEGFKKDSHIKRGGIFNRDSYKVKAE